MAFFCYNRPDHARRTLEALKANELASDSKLFIFSDGPKDSEKSSEGVAKVREYLSTVDGFASVEIIAREKNYGCGKNISEGITQIVNEFGKIIVVEDDVLTCPYFLRYINDALELYKDDENVGSVGGFLRRYDSAVNFPQSFFMRSPGIWGWGTWKRAWQYYEYDAGKLFAKLKQKGLIDEANLGIKPRYCTGSLKAQIRGELNAWAAQWSITHFIYHLLALYPCKTFTQNIGADGSGTHAGSNGGEPIGGDFAENYEPLTKIPVEINKYADELEIATIAKIVYSPLPYRIMRRLWRIVKRLFAKVSKSY